MTDTPDYILVIPKDDAIPEVMASCDKEDIDDLKEMKVEGMFIYKLVGKK